MCFQSRSMMAWVLLLSLQHAPGCTIPVKDTFLFLLAVCSPDRWLSGVGLRGTLGRSRCFGLQLIAQIIGQWSGPTYNHVVLGGELVGAVLVQAASQELGAPLVDQPLAHPPHQYLLLRQQQQVVLLCQRGEDRGRQGAELVGHGAPAADAEQQLNVLGGEALPLEEGRVEVGAVLAEVVAAGGQNAPPGVALQQPTHRNVQRLPAHVLAHPNQLQPHQPALYLLDGLAEGALGDGGVGHGAGEEGEVEVGDVALEALEVGVVLEEAVELVAPRLPLQQDVVAVPLELPLYLLGQRVRQDALARPELHVHELRRHHLVLEGLLGDQPRLQVVVGGVPQVLLARAADEPQPLLLLGEVLQVEPGDGLVEAVHAAAVDVGEGGDVDLLVDAVALPLVYVPAEPLAPLLLLPVHALGAVLEVLLQLGRAHEEPLLVGALHLPFQVAAVGRAELGALDRRELALPPLALDVELADGLGVLRGRLGLECWRGFHLQQLFLVSREEFPAGIA